MFVEFRGLVFIVCLRFPFLNPIWFRSKYPSALLIHVVHGVREMLKSQETRQLSKAMCKCEDNIKMYPGQGAML
jgi:hypothetical protein